MHTLIKGARFEQLGLQEATQDVLNECRMVLPGIQALFGFQMVAIFDEAFFKILSATERRFHLLAIAMTLVAIALVMGPAAYHRQVHPEGVSERHLRVSSWMLTLGMLPLLLALVIDFYLVARVISESVFTAAFIAGAFSVLFLSIWFVFPCVTRMRTRGGLK